MVDYVIYQHSTSQTSNSAKQTPNQTQIIQKEDIIVQSINLSNQEIKILQTLITYGTVNDANTFVADDLIITDDQAQHAIRRLQKRFNHLADNPKKEG